MNDNSKRAVGRGGFTLLEMIAVIGIIAIMTTLVVGGYGAMVAAVAENSAKQTFERAVNLARQEASIEGADVYVFVVDVDRFAIVRRAGEITKVEPKSQQAWGAGGGKVTARWIIDDYADLADRQDSFDMDLDDEAARNTFAKDYDGNLVFDIKEGVMARVKSPSRWESALDAWVFGIDDLPAPAAATATKFQVGHEYGWITHPVYTLPEGWVFADSYIKTGKNAGQFNYAVPRVHFLAGGSVENEVEFTFENPSRKNRTFKLKVSNKGVKREDSGS